MDGIETKFKCPCCKYSRIVDLGITPFVNIKGKGKHLAVRSCPKCKRVIAFAINENISLLSRTDLKISGNQEVIHYIINLVDSCNENEMKNEDTVKKKVIDAIQEKYGNDYISKYYTEIIQIMELEMAELTMPDTLSFDLNTINDEDIESDGVICY